MRLGGVHLPVTTPFQPQTFDLDAEALEANLRRWEAHPIRGIVVGGSTGEAPFLELHELAELVERAKGVLSEETLLIAGAGAESTRQTLRACRVAVQRGADAVLVRPPSYFREQMGPEALRRHFTEVADGSEAPVILYHVPKFVPVDLVPELVGRLVGHENVIGIKDSSGDLKSLGGLSEACADRGDVLVGSGAHLYAGLELGAVGGVLAVGLMAPGGCCEVLEAWVAGRTAAAGRAQEALGPLHRAVVAKAGVPGIKYALDLLGYRGGPPRPPLRPPGAPEIRQIRAALDRAGLLASTAPEARGPRTEVRGEHVR